MREWQSQRKFDEHVAKYETRCDWGVIRIGSRDSLRSGFAVAVLGPAGARVASRRVASRPARARATSAVVVATPTPRLTRTARTPRPTFSSGFRCVCRYGLTDEEKKAKTEREARRRR